MVWSDKMGKIISFKNIFQGYGTKCYLDYSSYNYTMHVWKMYAQSSKLQKHRAFKEWAALIDFLENKFAKFWDGVVVSSLSQGSKNKNLASSANCGFALAHLRRGCEQVPLEQVTTGLAEKQSHSGLGQNCCLCFVVQLLSVKSQTG